MTKPKPKPKPGEGQGELLPAPNPTLEWRRELCRRAMLGTLMKDWPDGWFAATYRLSIEEVQEIKRTT